MSLQPSFRKRNVVLVAGASKFWFASRAQIGIEQERFVSEHKRTKHVTDVGHRRSVHTICSGGTKTARTHKQREATTTKQQQQ